MTTPVAAKALIAELEQEAVSTRKLLERVPADKLAWRPHARSMTIGQLAQHVAGIPGHVSRLAQSDGFDTANARSATRRPSFPGLATHAAAPATASGAIPHTTSR